MMIDMDYFKQINDTYGHATGDQVLKIFAGFLKEQFRTTDIIGRVGGDEFYDPDEKMYVWITVSICICKSSIQIFKI